MRYGFIIRCDEVVRDDDGSIAMLRAHYFPESKSGSDSSGLKPKGVIQFVSEANAVEVEIREYDRLFAVRNPGRKDLEEELSPHSIKTHRGLVEKAIIEHPEPRFQFERIGYFVRDDSEKSQLPIFHRTAPLSDSWKRP